MRFYDGIVNVLNSEVVSASEYTGPIIIDKLLAVDGADSGLDADLLDGQHATAFATSSDLQLLISALNDKGLLKVNSPYFLPGQGTYSDGQTVTILCPTQGATIHYTTDSSTPTEESPVYMVPIQVNSTLVLKAIATHSLMETSEPGEASYTIESGAHSLWSNAESPSIEAVEDGTAIEVGISFYSDVSGHINGLKFYKGVGNGGTHTGTLWDANGNALAVFLFTDETLSGWQTAALGTPIEIEANTKYIASYFASEGHYSLSDSFFSSGEYDASPLHAYSNISPDKNGLFLYGSSGFPTDSYNGRNYWVDVLFV